MWPGHLHAGAWLFSGKTLLAHDHDRILILVAFAAAPHHNSARYPGGFTKDISP
jgi:hypothetical protein